MRRTLAALLGLVTLCSIARAELQIPGILSDNMVLQQKSPVPVWGWADDGDVVTVRFRNQKVTAECKNLKWTATLSSLTAGGPDDLVISTKDKTILLTNVLVGDVWVCSGQSNMQFPLKNATEGGSAVAAATNTQIRLFNVPRVRKDAPSIELKGAWQMLSPGSAESFSAVGYYFGREIQQTRNVPVGLIGSYWGGTPAEAWISRPSLELNPRYRTELLEREDAAREAWRASGTAAADKAGKAGKRPANAPWAGGELYNGMIAPLLPFPIKGVTWYQGEANATRAEQYRSLFPDLIRCWRRVWNQPDLPFLFVQLAPFKDIQKQPGESDWAELREAQMLAATKMHNVGMAVITDVGEEKDIHPRQKEPVGHRLALAARAIAYREQIEYSGPIYKSMGVQGNKIVITFDHAGSGLEARGSGPLTGFAICGPDRKWVWANAYIDGERRDRVVVSHKNVSKPVAVRYGWADYPVVNLWNKEGLPASPFRTDGFPMITAGDGKK